MRTIPEEEMESLYKTAAEACVTLRQTTEDQEGVLQQKAQQCYCALASLLHQLGILQQFVTIVDEMKRRGIIRESDDNAPGVVQWMPKDDERWIN